ncbi:MAG: hypothetical protein RL701_907 [Pseudomonadota bacterium]|jgi:hypothetical protein
MLKMLRSARRLVFVACVWVGCGDDDAPPGAPVSVDTSNGTDKRDAAANAAGDDGGSAEAKPDASVKKSACGSVPVLRGASEDYPSATSTESPSDFTVRMQGETWVVDDCTQPKLTLLFSDGVCPRGAGHQLQITLDLNDVSDGLIHSGPNNVTADGDSTGISVRYTRPKALKPAGTWGTCTSATGQVLFLNEPSVSATATLEARYNFSLTPCDGSDQAAQLLVGSFKLPLAYGLRRFCPDRTE